MLFHQRFADPLRHAADQLAVHQHRIDDHAGVIHPGQLLDLHFAGVGRDRYAGNAAAAAPGLARGMIGLRRHQRAAVGNADAVGERLLRHHRPASRKACRRHRQSRRRQDEANWPGHATRRPPPALPCRGTGSRQSSARCRRSRCCGSRARRCRPAFRRYRRAPRQSARRQSAGRRPRSAHKRSRGPAPGCSSRWRQ